jgi:hypothetical protein
MSRTLSKLCALLLALVVFPMTAGCSTLTQHQKAYAVAAISKTVIDEADRELWHPMVEAQTDQCDPETNDQIETKEDFDECLGPIGAADDKVQAALTIYVKAAEVLFAILKETEPNPDDLRTAKQKALDAALAVLGLMGPEAGRYLDNLKALTRGK